MIRRQVDMLSGKEVSVVWAVSKAFMEVRHSIRISEGSMEVDAMIVLERNGGIAMICLREIFAFLASVVVVLTSAGVVRASNVAQEGTRVSSVSSRKSSCKRSARGRGENPLSATMTLSGMAMFPPRTVR